MKTDKAITIGALGFLLYKAFSKPKPRGSTNGLGKTGSGSKEIALEILRQLGGNKFLAMTGARNLAYDEYSLQMQLPRNRSGAKYLKIELLASDTYRMTFRKQNKKNFTFPIVAEYSDVYNDQLQDIFTEVTGFDTHL